ncbi:cytochrome P450 monooxygenase [Aspergillus avenaceus]|uniref:Cytochrome P450 monooxygenase n=1 Tax=Aspergillus avenaceus TaxID=36643 RepID=A0A5N6U0B1_ASPAV|nr:cytochrome P450 monooxygenase [Aspergillus avenaceus]
MSSIALGLIVLGVIYLLYNTWPLYRNWKRARRLGMPVIVSPVTTGSLLWLVVVYSIRHGSIPTYLHRLPYVRVMRISWSVQEKQAVHKELGKLFIRVTPTDCELFVADRVLAKQILQRRDDFQKPRQMMEMLNTFGTSLALVDGTDWQRHRKVTGRAFHEKMHQRVWIESSKYASSIVNQWSTTESVRSTRSDMTTLSLYVLFKTCLGIDAGEGIESGEILAADIAACQYHLTAFLEGISRPPTLRRGRMVWDELDKNRKALGELLREIVQARRWSSRKPQPDLLSSMIASTDDYELTPDEITGNLFLFIFAGHETTANTLIFIIHLLAIMPIWQDWAREEVDQLPQRSDVSEGLGYQDAFPSMVRLRAILYETLRLYGPVPTVVRKTNNQDQLVRFEDEDVVIPKGTNVFINTIAMHTDPEQWGSDPLAWRPDRWISQGPGSGSTEQLRSDMTKNLFSWGDGPRICPGQKFSQIEVLAVLLSLLKNHHVGVVPRPDQTLDVARSCAYKLIQNSKMGLTLHMPDAESVSLRWTHR